MSTNVKREAIRYNTNTESRNVRVYRTNETRRRARRSRGIINNRLFRISFVAFLAVFICVAGILSITAKGSERPVQKQYKSIQIEEGDTLWSIALEYNDSNLSKNSTSEYIDDILHINNLVRDDKITAGNYIIVPVYVALEQ